MRVIGGVLIALAVLLIGASYVISVWGMTGSYRAMGALAECESCSAGSCMVNFQLVETIQGSLLFGLTGFLILVVGLGLFIVGTVRAPGCGAGA